jgi:hypothetical protein
MMFLATLLQGMSFIPAVVHGVEALFGSKTGGQKKQAALQFVSSAMGVDKAVESKQIGDAEKFAEGLGKVIDGVVECLNASVWKK